MMTALLAVIFFSFIGVGLPDSVLGTAWPAMTAEMGLPVSMAGSISATASVGTILSSLMSGNLLRRYGTGRVTAVSTLLTALALAGYAMAPGGAWLFLLAIPLGLGGGCIDTALNNFVALHYSAAQMNYLHCFYGLGVTLSPGIMSVALSGSGWRAGYWSVAGVQLLITAAAFLALPLWKKAETRFQEEEGEAGASLPMGQLLRRPGVALCCCAFFAACALELSAGSWSSSYFVHTRGLTPDRAAATAMLFYMGLACGRFLSGVASPRLSRERILLIGSCLLLGGCILFALPLPVGATAAGLFVIGLGVGPIFPNLTHLTPDHFGKALSQSVMGLQMAASYAGVMLMPMLFGQLTSLFTTALLPLWLLLMFAGYAATLLAMFRQLRR